MAIGSTHHLLLNVIVTALLTFSPDHSQVRRFLLLPRSSITSRRHSQGGIESSIVSGEGDEFHECDCRKPVLGVAIEWVRDG
jgi:hypothetical protein